MGGLGAWQSGDLAVWGPWGAFGSRGATEPTGPEPTNRLTTATTNLGRRRVCRDDPEPRGPRHSSSGRFAATGRPITLVACRRARGWLPGPSHVPRTGPSRAACLRNQGPGTRRRDHATTAASARAAGPIAGPEADRIPLSIPIVVPGSRRYPPAWETRRSEGRGAGRFSVRLSRRGFNSIRARR